MYLDPLIGPIGVNVEKENQVIHFCVIAFLSLLSDLILSLPHWHRYIAIYIAHIVVTILGRMSYGMFILYCCTVYVVVSQQFDKHLYLTSCLNAHNH